MEQSETNVVFRTYEYGKSWYEAYGKNSELFVLLAVEGTKLLAIAPLTISVNKKLGFKTRTVEQLASSRSDYSDMVIGPPNEEILREFYNYIWTQKHRWDVIRLRQIPEESSTIKLSKKILGRENKPFVNRSASPCPTILLKERAEEVLKRFKKDKTMRKRINRIKRIGELTFGHAETIEEGLVYLNDFFQQHINRWEPTPTPSFFYNKSPREFYCNLVRELIPKGWLRLSYLKLDGVPIAYYFAYEYNHILASQRPSYDSLYARYSPSRIHIQYAVNYCIEKGLKEFDMLAGVEDYKLEIANSVHYNQTICVFKSRWKKLCSQLKFKAKSFWPFSLFFGESKIHDLRMNLRKYRDRYGTSGMLKKAIHKITSRIIDFSSNQLFEWNGDPVPALTAECPLEIRIGSEAELNRIVSFHGLTEDAPRINQFKERLEKGDKPYLAFSGQTLAHVAWLCHRPHVEMTEIWGKLAFKENEAYIMNCKTSFIFRGKNTYPVVLQSILKDMTDKNIEKVFITCRTSNTASIKGIKKAGFRPQRKIRAFRLFGKKIGAKIIQAG